MTGSVEIGIGITWWTIDHKFPETFFKVAVVIYFIIGIYAVLRKYIKENHVANEKLRASQTPKLSIETYVEYVKAVGLGECRKTRIGVKNNSLIKASNVHVKVENCIPGDIPVKYNLSLSEGVGHISIGPEQERSFDLITELNDRKRFYINLDIQTLEPMTDKETREIEISANCDESVPTKATFRIEKGSDGFFSTHRVS